MQVPRALVIFRLVALAALLGWLLMSLRAQVRERHAPARIAIAALNKQAQELVDPGVRILLTKRADSSKGEAAARVHPTLTIVVRQAARLYAPEDPLRTPLALPGGSQLTILPDASAGLVLGGTTLSANVRWPVRRVRLVPDLPPHNGERSLTPAEEAVQLGRDDLEAADRQPLLSIGPRFYRGALDVWWAGPKSMAAINTMPVESYLEGVLQAEMSADYPEAALMAQAVASRTVTWLSLLRGPRRMQELGAAWIAYHLEDADGDQRYDGTGRGGPRIQRALADTVGQVLTINGVPFRTFFHASSGGSLAHVDEVFPGERAVDGRTRLTALLVAKDDPYCRPGLEALGLTGSHWTSTLTVTSAELREVLRRNRMEVGYPQSLQAVRSSSGRTAQVAIGFFNQQNAVTLNAEQFRGYIGSNRLRSSLWSPESPVRADDKWTITTIGWGHGVGMSQVSAYAMARFHGDDYRDILHFFYGRDTRLMTAWKARP
jgi:SpoIID/LytB domain protein